jgi:hypothetical protein
MPDYTTPRPPSSPFPEEAGDSASPNPARIAPPMPRPAPPTPSAALPMQCPTPRTRPMRPPARPARTAATPVAVAEADPAGQESKPDLTMTKVIAGAGAAATSAVMGSYLGAVGTVGGAAIGSVVSMVGASLYQHYLERTGDTVRARVRLPGGRTVTVTEQVEVPAPRSALDADAAPTQVLVTPVDATPTTSMTGTAPARRPADQMPPSAAAAPVIAPRRPGRRGAMVGAAVVLTFLIGMLAVTGIEWLKGSTLNSGQSGTSVGHVLKGDSGAPEATDTGSDDGDSNGDSNDSEGDSEGDSSTDGEQSGSTRSAEPSSPDEEDTERSTTRAPNSANRSTTPTTTFPAPSVDRLPGR